MPQTSGIRGDEKSNSGTGCARNTAGRMVKLGHLRTHECGGRLHDFPFLAMLVSEARLGKERRQRSAPSPPKLGQHRQQKRHQTAGRRVPTHT